MDFLNTGKGKVVDLFRTKIGFVHLASHFLIVLMREHFNRVKKEGQ